MVSAVTLIGAGGSEFTFDLPLGANYIKQLERNQLRPASDRDAALIAGAAVEDEADDEVVDVVPSGDGEVERPPGNATTDAWRDYAGHVGVQVDADATRDEIRDAVDAAGH